jgi:hypothetical protein
VQQDGAGAAQGVTSAEPLGHLDESVRTAAATILICTGRPRRDRIVPVDIYVPLAPPRRSTACCSSEQDRRTNTIASGDGFLASKRLPQRSRRPSATARVRRRRSGEVTAVVRAAELDATLRLCAIPGLFLD